MNTNVTTTLTPDDTHDAPLLETRAIKADDFQHGYDALNNHLVQYRHRSDSRKLYFGHIVSVTESKFGLDIYVQPLPGYYDACLVKSFVMNDVKLVGGAS